MEVIIIDEMKNEAIRREHVRNESEYNTLAQSLDVMQAAVIVGE
jgi:hypothetical protein